MDTQSNISLSSESAQIGEVSSISSIPEDLLMDILLRLPVKDVLRSRPVCKEWNSLSRTPKFISLHYDYSLKMRSHEHNDGSSSFIFLRTAYAKLYNWMPEHIQRITKLTFCTLKKTSGALLATVDKEVDFSTIISSLLMFPANAKLPTKLKIDGFNFICPFDGLICFGYEEGVIIYNPATRESKLIHSKSQFSSYEFRYPARIRCKLDILGVWFEPTMKQRYKVFRMVRWKDYKIKSGNIDNLRKIKIEIYDSVLNSWRISNAIFGEAFPSTCLLFNGIVHFYMWKDFGIAVITFDATLETFGQLELPCFIEHYDGGYLLPYYGKLALFHLNIHDGNTYFDTWVMTEYGVKQSWTKKYSILASVIGYSGYDYRVFRPLAFWKSTNDQDELMVITYDGEKIMSINLVTRKMNDLKLPRLPCGMTKVVTNNVESLISFK